MASNVSVPAIKNGMSESQKYAFDKMHNLLADGNAGVDKVADEMQSSLQLDNANNAAAHAGIEEEMKSNIYNDLTTAAYHDDLIQQAMGNSVGMHLNDAINNIAAAGQEPVMSPTEKVFYDTLSPAEAFTLNSLSKSVDTNHIVTDPSPPVPPITKVPPVTTPPVTVPPIIVPPVTVPPVVVSIPPPPTEPIMPIQPGDDEVMYYLCLENASGGITSIPTPFPKGTALPTGYSLTPCTSPPPGPAAPNNPGCSDGPQTIPTVSGYTPYYVLNTTSTSTLPVAVVQYVQTGNQPDDSSFQPVTGPLSGVCIEYLPPSPGIPPTIPPSSSPPSSTNPPPGFNCYPIFPPSPPPGASPPPPPIITCPPGCVPLSTITAPIQVPAEDCVDWDNVGTVCRAASTAASGILPGSGTIGLSQQINTVTTQAPSQMPTLLGIGIGAFEGISSFTGASAGDIIKDGVSFMVGAGITAVNDLITAYSTSCGIKIDNLLSDCLQLSGAGWAERLSGAPCSYIVQDKMYALQFELPQYIPSQGEIDNMYLAGELTYDQWTCYTKANGNLPKTHALNLRTKRTRIGAKDLILLNRLGELTDDDYANAIRDMGVIDPIDQDRLEQSQVTIPQLGDTIRFMMRDVENDEIAQKYGYDDGFTDKYTGDLQAWAKAQGIPDDYAQDAWRAHWSLPSLGEALQMYRRPYTLQQAELPPLTDDDLYYVMGANGIPEYWADRFAAIANKVIERGDIQNMYNKGAITLDQVTNYLLNLGYTQDDANQLAKLIDKNKKIYCIQYNSRFSALSPKMIARGVGDGSINQDDARLALQNIGLDENAIDALITSAQLKASAASKKECINGAKKQYFNGQYTLQEAVDSIVNAGVDQGTAATLSNGWYCEFQSRSKDLSAQKNVTLFLHGIITPDELTTRLQNLNYTPDAVSGWVSDALFQQQQATQKALEKAAKQAAAALKAQQKAVQAAQKAAQVAYDEAHKTESITTTVGGKVTQETIHTDTTHP